MRRLLTVSSRDRSTWRAALISAAISTGALVMIVGCASPAGGIVGGILGTTLLVGEAPNQELEQVYYLGVFDPDGQLPEAVYRVTVRGQASVLSGMKFASGWVPAPLIDSLTTSVNFNNPTSRPALDSGGAATQPSLQTGRRLVLFGPEGFREAPKDQRLVIVMGSSPDAYFNAIDQVLGGLGTAKAQKLDPTTSGAIYKALADAQAQQDKLKDLDSEVTRELAD